jgi:hypothetical protein
MKRLIILFLIILISVSQAQNFSTKDGGNSTTGSVAVDKLAANGVFIGAWKLVTNYNSMSLAMYSDSSSATNGIKIYQADRLMNGTYTILDSTYATYTLATVYKITIPIIAPYLKVKYTNGTKRQNYFYLITMLNVGQNLNFDASGNLIVTSSTGATSANQLLAYVPVYDTVLTITTASALPSYACNAVRAQLQTAGDTLRIGVNARVATQGNLYFVYDEPFTPVYANANELFCYSGVSATVRFTFYRRK